VYSAAAIRLNAPPPTEARHCESFSTFPRAEALKLARVKSFWIGFPSPSFHGVS